jgi:hypothetical protein
MQGCQLSASFVHQSGVLSAKAWLQQLLPNALLSRQLFHRLMLRGRIKFHEIDSLHPRHSVALDTARSRAICRADRVARLHWGRRQRGATAKLSHTSHHLSRRQGATCRRSTRPDRSAKERLLAGGHSAQRASGKVYGSRICLCGSCQIRPPRRWRVSSGEP